jgi:hypothetical protein
VPTTPARIKIDQLVYATVVLMSVLVVYDGWQDLTTFGGVALVILGPMVALYLAHLFAEVLHEHAERQRPLARSEWGHIAVAQTVVFLAAVPPLVVLGLGWLSPVDARGTIQLLLWTGMLTLVGLTGVAARRAGIRGWRFGAALLGGGLVGLVVIALQVVLKPH